MVVGTPAHTHAPSKHAVLVEVDVGQGRCGVATAEEAVALAHQVTTSAGLVFKGIQCYHGAAQHVRSTTERAALGALCYFPPLYSFFVRCLACLSVIRSPLCIFSLLRAVAGVADKARTVRDAIRAAGIACDTVTGGGTGTFQFEAASGVFTGTLSFARRLCCIPTCCGGIPTNSPPTRLG